MRIGDVVADRFELEKLAGTGGMGAVYRSRDRQSGLTVALKSLHDPGGRHAERFLREAQVLATLNHPNIVRYVAHGRTETGELYMAMEWIEGVSLSQRIAETSGLSIGESLAVTSQLASALAFAHARGIIHRDIKPSNVWVLEGTLVPKLLDFGIARLAQAARLTSNGMMLGTPGYMSPEQCRGAASVTARADVFSLGCLLFKCLAGRPPFVGDDMRSLMAQVLFETAPRVTSLRPEIPRELDELVARMLTKEASARPADGAVVLAELRAIAAGVPGASSSAFDVPEAIGDGELQWICAVLAREPKVASDGLRTTQVPALELRGTEQAIPIAHFIDAKRGEPKRSASAFEIPQVAGGEVSPEIGTVIDSMGGAAPELVNALRPFDAEVDQLADGSLLTTLGDDADPVALACRAVRCARALLAASPTLRVMITTGRALRSDHPGVGPALDRAAGALRSMVHGPAGIRLDLTTAQLVRGRFEFDLAVQPATLGADTDPLALAHSPLRGRERELAKLVDFVDRSMVAGRLRWGLLVGPPGVGLTRILRELRRTLSSRNVAPRLCMVAADPAETHSPFSLVRRLLIAANVDATRLRAYEANAPGMTVLALVGNLQVLLGELARVQPLVIAIDDLDRADPASLALLARALPADAPVPLTVVATGRQLLVRRIEPLGVSGELRELEPLPDEVAAEIVHDRSSGKIRGEPLETLVRQASGNPWMLRALVEGGVSLVPGGFPEPALARTAARLEDLGANARRVLRAVSLWEGDVSRGDLGALLGGAASGPSVESELESLVRGGWLERRGDGGLWGEATYHIAEPIVAEAARAQFTESDRVLAHRLAAVRLEQRAAPDAALIAWHWERAGQVARGAEHHRRAAAAALGTDELETAARHADRGLESATDDGLRQPLLAYSAESHLWLGELDAAVHSAALIQSTNPPSSDAFARASLQLAVAGAATHERSRLEALADALLQIPVWAEARVTCAAAIAGTALGELGDAMRASALERRLPARPEDAHSPHATAARLHVDGWRHSRAGSWSKAHVAFRASAQALTRADEPRLGLHQQMLAGSALALGGVLDQAEAALRKVRAQAEREGLRLVQAPAALRLAGVLLALDQVPEGELRLAEAIELSDAQRTPSIHATALLERSGRHRSQGREVDALADALAALEALQPLPVLHLGAQIWLASLRVISGELAAGMALARGALTQLDTLGGDAGSCELEVRSIAAEIFFRSGLRDLGRQQLARARDRIATELGRTESPWREGLARSPAVLRLAALAAEWMS